MNHSQKKIALINDLTGYGHCSLAVALPVVSVMGVYGCPVPTAVFSNHMAFPTWYKKDLTDNIDDYLKVWEQLKIDFDGIYCGFLGNEKQAEMVASFVKMIKNNGSSDTMFLLDPVMGDHGQMYSSVNSAYRDALLKLIPNADVLTPNLTEACLLTDTTYNEDILDKSLDNYDVSDCAENIASSFLTKMVQKLHTMGPSRIVITGIKKDGYFFNYVSEAGISDGSHKSCFVIQKAEGESRPGTGDLFASILAADAVKGVSFTTSVKKAAEFVKICTKTSSDYQLPATEGVCFEENLKWLIE